MSIQQVLNDMKTDIKLNGKDILLLLLYTPSESEQIGIPINGRTRLTKMVFVFKEEIYKKARFDKMLDPDKLPKFYAWNYGPFSRDVYSDIDFFIHIGFIQAKAYDGDQALSAAAEEYSLWESELSVDTVDVTEYTEECLELAPLGKRYIEEKNLWNCLSEHQRKCLIEFKHKFTHAPLYAILKYVYDNYPDYTDKSVIKDKVAAWSP